MRLGTALSPNIRFEIAVHMKIVLTLELLKERPVVDRHSDSVGWREFVRLSFWVVRALKRQQQTIGDLMDEFVRQSPRVRGIETGTGLGCARVGSDLNRQVYDRHDHRYGRR